MAHPDYATYFNFLAGPKPEEICTSSRGGGDIWRLASRLKQFGAQHVCLLLGQDELPLDVFGLPPYTLLERNTPCEGWVAVGLYRYRIDQHNLNRHNDPDPGLRWLAAYQPVERIEPGILLYRIPATAP
jgi:hypothetical protein